MTDDLVGEMSGIRLRRIVVAWSATLTGLGLVAAGLLAGPRWGRAGPPLAFGAAALLLGLAAVVPLVVRPVANALGDPLVLFSANRRGWRGENLIRNPRRTAVTAGALTVGIALIGLVAILGSSMKASAAKALADTMRADFVINAKGVPGRSTGTPPAIATRLAATPGVSVVSTFRLGQCGRPKRVAGR